MGGESYKGAVCWQVGVGPQYTRDQVRIKKPLLMPFREITRRLPAKFLLSSLLVKARIRYVPVRTSIFHPRLFPTIQ